jgi:hypothetical protein
MIEVLPPMEKYKYDTWRILLMKCYIDNYMRLRSCIQNVNTQRVFLLTRSRPHSYRQVNSPWNWVRNLESKWKHNKMQANLKRQQKSDQFGFSLHHAYFIEHLAGGSRNHNKSMTTTRKNSSLWSGDSRTRLAYSRDNNNTRKLFIDDFHQTEN